MGHLHRGLVTCFLAVVLLFVFADLAHASPYRHYKVEIGMPFVYFDIADIYNQRWVSTYLRGRPTVILTAHRDQRFEVLKWADMLRREFGLPGLVHVLWVVNLRHFPWSTSRATITDQWRSFGPPVPLLLDWQGRVGSSLRINYNVPNIIGIDAFGRLAMHEMHTFTPEVYNAVAMRIRALIAATPVVPGLVGPVGAVNPGMPPIPPLTPGPIGRKGYSE